MFDIEENLKKLPDCPGVYIHKDKLGQVIYVGKAVSLKNRVRQYFRSPAKMDMKVKSMVSQIAEFEYIKCGTEMEALILECNLIKKYVPKYNVVLRDDKTYPYIKVTVSEDYPRLLKTRRIEKDGAKYFGPYADASAVNTAVELLGEIYMLKCCSLSKFPQGHKPCLNYHIQRCRGICTGNVEKKSYAADIEHALEFLGGKNSGLLGYLKGEMGKAAEQMNFEKAAKFRDYIESVKTISEKQRVTLFGLKDTDIVLTIKSEKRHSAALFSVRGGKLQERETHHLNAREEDDEAAVAAAFIKQYYNGSALIPKEIIVGLKLPERELIEEFLSGLAGQAVKITSPQRGKKKALLDLAKNDTDEMVKSIDEKYKLRNERKRELGNALSALLGEREEAPAGRDFRIEAYDISNTNGIDTVGGMVVFEGTRPSRKDYRRFKVKAATGGDDCGCFQEIVERRLKRAMEKDPGFTNLPDMILVDGGKAQAAAVEKVLKTAEMEIPVLGMVKDEHHRTRGLIYRGEEKPLKDNPALFKYVGTIQEETHRFAIEYHRGLRDKKMRGSVLDNIEGIGPKRRDALLAHFGSIERIKSADTDELRMVKGVTGQAALNVIEYFGRAKDEL